MIRNLLHFHARSLLLVLAAFIGNGQVIGIDIVLLLMVLTLILQSREPWRIYKKSVLTLIVITAILMAAVVRAPDIGIPYFHAYSLWPIKALCLTFLIAFGGALRWPMGNTVLLALICIALIAVGRFEGGRLVSVFGPNMLYRIFGFLLFFSTMLFFQYRGGNRLLIVCFAAFGLFAALLTGSTGALLVILAVTVAALWRISRKVSLILCGLASYLMLIGGELLNTLAANMNVPTAFARLIYKLGTLQANDRLIGWYEIITKPLSIVGYTHADFGNLWFYGYSYPHNIAVELIGFFGFIGVALMCLVAAAIAKSIPQAIHGEILSMTFIVLTVGAMLSGDLSDNYGVIGLACGIILRPSARIPEHTDRQIIQVSYENSHRFPV